MYVLLYVCLQMHVRKYTSILYAHIMSANALSTISHYVHAHLVCVYVCGELVCVCACLCSVWISLVSFCECLVGMYICSVLPHD